MPIAGPVQVRTAAVLLDGSRTDGDVRRRTEETVTELVVPPRRFLGKDQRLVAERVIVDGGVLEHQLGRTRDDVQLIILVLLMQIGTIVVPGRSDHGGCDSGDTEERQSNAQIHLLHEHDLLRLARL